MDNISESLVIGGNHQNTLGVIVALGRKGIRPNVIIIGSELVSSFVLTSRYVKEGYICNDETNFVTTVNHILSSTQNNVVAIACSDDAAVMLDNNYMKFQDNLIYPSLLHKGELSSWMNKTKQTSAANFIGLDVPKSWFVNDNSIPNDIVYPCLAKPLTSVQNGKKGFCKCSNEEELLKYISEKSYNKSFQLQQYIDKEYEFQFLGCSLNNGEEIYIPGRTHIETTTGYNNLVFLKFDNYEPEFNELVVKTKKFIKLLGYSGLFSVEFMRGQDGKDYFLEMNCRNDGNGIAVTSSGTNLPYIWHLAAGGGDYYSEMNSSSVKTTYMMPEVSFLLSMFNGEVSFRDWFSDMRRTTCYLTRFKDDKKPFKIYMRSQRRILFLSFVKYLLVKLHLMNLIKKIK